MFVVKQLVIQHGRAMWAVMRAVMPDGQPRIALTQGEVMDVLGCEPPVLALRNDGPERPMIFRDDALGHRWAVMLRDQLNGIAAQRQGAA